MKTQDVNRKVAELAAERGWEEGSPLEVYLLNLLVSREEARISLQTKITALRRDLDRLEKILRADSPLLNSLGELHQRPAAVEAAVGEFAAADKAFCVFLETFPVGVDPS